MCFCVHISSSECVEVSNFKYAHSRKYLRFPRVPYRAFPSFHPGLCRSAALAGLFVGLFAVSPGFHIGLCPHFTLGFAGVPPLQGSFHSFICVSPGFHIGLCPHSTLGFAGVPPLQGSLSYCLCIPRVSYRALPSFHPGLCRSVALAGLIVGLLVYPQGFISCFALIPPWARQEYRPYRALRRFHQMLGSFDVLVRHGAE